MSTTTSPQLHPLTAGDILDQAIRIYRRNFLPLVTIVAIVSVPFAIIQAILLLVTNPFVGGFSNPSSFNPESLSSTTYLVGQGLTYLVGLLAAIATLFEQGALAAFVSERFLGRPVTVRQAYGRAMTRWLSLLIAAILFGLAVFVLIGVVFGFAFVPLIGFAALGASGLSSGASSTAATLSGIFTLLACCLVIPALLVAVFLGTRWAFFEQAIVLENYNSTGGLGRSWKLVKGTFWRVLGMLFVLGLIVYLFSLGPSLLLVFGALLLPSPIFAVIINSFVSSLIIIILTPLQSAAMTILYYDLRIRKEGFDLQLQMQDLPAPNSLYAPSSPEPPAPIAPPPQPATVPPAQDSTTQEPPLDLPPLFSRDDYSPK